MNQPIVATRDHNRRGGWAVPVGSILRDEIKDCDHCGHGVNVLTVRTKDGPVVMADDIFEYADDDTTVCRDCKDA